MSVILITTIYITSSVWVIIIIEVVLVNYLYAILEAFTVVFQSPCMVSLLLGEGLFCFSIFTIHCRIYAQAKCTLVVVT